MVSIGMNGDADNDDTDYGNNYYDEVDDNDRDTLSAKLSMVSLTLPVLFTVLDGLTSGIVRD